MSGALRRLELTAANPGALAEFYAGRLGMDAERAGDGAVLAAGATTIAFAAAPAGRRRLHHVALRIPSDAYDAAVEWVCARVEPLLDEGIPRVRFDAWNADAVYFVDPAGNIVELIAHHDLPERLSGAFGPDAILGLCELGLPSTSVAARLDELEASLGLAPWSGDRETFAAVGAKPFSFIVVPLGRPWFLTEVRAEAFPAAVELADGRRFATTGAEG